MPLMKRNSFCRTLIYSQILVPILILFIWMGNVESAPLYMTNQNRAKIRVLIYSFYSGFIFFILSVSGGGVSFSLSLSSVSWFHGFLARAQISNSKSAAWMLNH